MADLSLDEFIKKNNVNVRVSNTKRVAQTKGKLKPKGGGGFDARQKLGVRAPVRDARDKIVINKKSGKGDARNKIVSKQVQQGKFDARSLIKRPQKKGQPAAFTNQSQGVPQTGLALTRTLSNPNAKGKYKIQLTDSGLKVTRPVPNTQVSLKNNSLQVTKRNQSFKQTKILRGPQAQKDFVPIIQIRNDRYKAQQQQPVAAVSARSSSQYGYADSSQQYNNPQHGHSYPNPVPAFSSQRGYRDYDDPQYNTASVAVPDVPKFHISNVRPVQDAGMQPVSYSSRAPPGAATLSQRPRPSAPSARPALVATKRRQPPPPAPQQVSGPLRLGRGGGPGIELRTPDPHSNGSYGKRAKYESVYDARVEDTTVEDADLISPLQGYRVLVTNLFTGVTQDDIIELFGAVGPLKKAKLLRAGSAEVVYINQKDALSAVQKYHSRELDGQPMYVKMTTPAAAVVKKAVGDYDPDITGEALRVYKKGTGMGSLPEAPIEVPVIHRALFKAGPPGPNKSVKFTVKI